jgi:hypothetical protein
MLLGIHVIHSPCVRFSIEAVPFLSFMAVNAFSARVNHTAYPDSVTKGKLCDYRTNLGNNSSDLMPWNERIVYSTPLAASCLYVRVANTSVLNLNEDIMRLKVPALYRGQFEGTFWTECNTCFSSNHI